MPISRALRAVNDGDGDGDGVPTTAINIALVTSSAANVGDERRDGLSAALEGRPFLEMTGIRLSISDVPTAASGNTAMSLISPTWTDDHVDALMRADMACFEDARAVLSYLTILDERNGVSPELSNEERRGLPNRPPDTVHDVFAGRSDGGGGHAIIAPLMAACPDPETARECLNSGRWTSNHIYYPKGARQDAVELKILPMDSTNDSGGEGGGGHRAVDVEAWADAVVQAAGDVMERNFWGGGW